MTARVVGRVGTEFEILVELSEEVLRKQLSPKVAQGVLRVRSGQLTILPGFDGEYGQVKIFKEAEEPVGEKQMTLFE